MLTTLVLASAILGQCPGGTCRPQSRGYAYASQGYVVAPPAAYLSPAPVVGHQALAKPQAGYTYAAPVYVAPAASVHRVRVRRGLFGRVKSCR